MITILGFYNFDPDIFEDLAVPEGIEKQDVIDAILLECSELELLYSSFTVMKIAIKSWCSRELTSWEKLQATVTAEYNPLWNVDASITESGTSEKERSGTGTNEGTDIHSVTGYNSSSWSNNDKLDSDTEQNWSEDESGSDTRSIIRTGNIGVTSSQQLISQEREVAKFNVIDYIVESFKKRFCLLVY